jgi:FMN phosphatase YigB (HAD superfamily)
VRYRVVIFDLWQTLVPFSVESANEMNGRLVEAWGADPQAFDEI